MQPPDLIDPDYTGMVLLLTNLHAAVAYLERMVTQPQAAAGQTFRCYARHTYDEMIGMMPRLVFSDDHRRRLESQLAVLKVRLIQLGEEFSDPPRVHNDSEA